jgi:hypothetical protein
MKAKKWMMYLSLTGFITGVFIALTPFVILPVCTKLLELASGAFAHMVCNWTGIVEVIFGIIIGVISIANFFLIRLGESGRMAGISLTALGIAGMLVPRHDVIGICRNPEMPCHTTVNLLYPLFAVVIIIGIVLLLLQRKISSSTES